jgi:hypothetical protein
MTKREAKAAYDRIYRAKNIERITAQKAAYFQRTYDPATAAVVRKKRMPYHVEYCRRPDYRKKKAAYDRRREAAEYGEFAECRDILKALVKEIKRQEPDRMVRYAQAQRFQWSPFTHAKRRDQRAKERAKRYLESFRIEP